MDGEIFLAILASADGLFPLDALPQEEIHDVIYIFRIEHLPKSFVFNNLEIDIQFMEWEFAEQFILISFEIFQKLPLHIPSPRIQIQRGFKKPSDLFLPLRDGRRDMHQFLFGQKVTDVDKALFSCFVKPSFPDKAGDFKIWMQP